MNETKIEFTADGVNVANRDNVRDEEFPEISIKPVMKGRFNSRSITKKVSPRIYVNDGSNGSNLINTYSYKNYCYPNEKSSIENNYSNNYKTATTTNSKYCEVIDSKFINGPVDGLRLHPTGDSGGYSNFTISQFVKHN